MKAQPGVAPLAPLSPLSPGDDLKQEVESKNGTRNGMEQDEEEDGEVHEEEEGAEPYCQPRHRPFPSVEELQDRKYWAKLQVKLNLFDLGLILNLCSPTIVFRTSMLQLMLLRQDRINLIR